VAFPLNFIQLIANFDELIDETSDSFIQTGLRQSSIIRLGFLAVIPKNNIPGSIGRIDKTVHESLLKRLAEYLTQ
jgi:mRNA interferase MazF